MAFSRAFPKTLVAALLVASACTGTQAQITCNPTDTIATFFINVLTPGIPLIDSSCAGLTDLFIVTGVDTLPVDALAPLSNLILLGIGNSIQSLPLGIFDVATDLTYLDISSNGLTELPPGQFDLLTKLELLFIDSNAFVDLPDGIFDPLTNLISLQNNNNDLVELQSGIFDSLSSLVFLCNDCSEISTSLDQDLTGNELQGVPPGLLDSTSNLLEVDLDSNDLTSLPQGLFDFTPDITRLLLGNNDFTSLPFDLFAPLDNPVVLDLSINPFLTCAPPTNALSYFGPTFCVAPPVTCPPPPPPAECNVGDANGDGLLTINDLVAFVELIVG